MRQRMKSELLTHLTLALNIARVLLMSGLALGIYWQRLHIAKLIAILDALAGRSMPSLLVNLLSNAVWAIPGLALYLWSPRIAAHCRRRLFHVNKEIAEKDLKRFRAYASATQDRLAELLPEELRSIAEDSSKRPLLITLHAEEQPTAIAMSGRSPYIPDVVDLIESEYLLNESESVDPLFIEGEPGSGKSTLFFEVFRRVRHAVESHGHGWIPLVIFANDLSLEMMQDKASFREFLLTYFIDRRNPQSSSSYDAVLELIRTGYDRYRFLIIIDGLDEFMDRRRYEEFAECLNRLIDRRSDQDRKDKKPFDGRHRYLLSCRRDDNQRKIRGRLITLLPFDQTRVERYLHKLSKEYQSNSIELEQARRKQAATVLQALRDSRKEGLLQNYVTNPYLLQQIRECYANSSKPLAQTLNEVFDRVLVRELSKVLPSEDAPKFVRSLLAPYAYLRVSGTFVPGGSEDPDFRDCIRADTDLENCLFGDDGQSGYLRGSYARSADPEEYVRLRSILGRTEAAGFAKFLSEAASPDITFEQFCAKAIDFLKRRLIELLRSTNLVIWSRDNSTIERFRHRRLQDYFMATYMARMGIRQCHLVADRLANAWIREPLRLFAAIAEHPEELLSLFIEECDRRFAAGQAATFDQFNALSNLMLNAAAAVAYLPASRKIPPRTEIVEAVLELGYRAHRLYHQVQRLTLQDMEDTGDLLLLREKCLQCLGRIYASEILSTNLWLQAEDAIASVCYPAAGQLRVNSWILIHRWTLKQSDVYQHEAYKSLYGRGG